VLAARIDRLPADERQLLQASAVVGKDVPYALLQAIARREEAALRVGLTHLQATGFLYEARLFPDLEYTFKHALTHEVAYASLLPDDRRTLHGRVVETIETLHRSRLVEQQERLAYHALRAEMWDKAFTYFRGAGAKAVARSAYPESLAYFEQALVAVRHLPESRDLLEQAVDFRVDLRRTLFVLGQLDQSWRYLNEAEALARKLGDQRRLGWVSSELAHHFWQIGRWREALPFAERAGAIGKDLHELPLRVVADFHLGQVYLAAGEYRRAAELFQENVEVLPGTLRRESFGMSCFQAPTSWAVSWVGSSWRCSGAYLATCLAALGRFDEAIGYGEEAVRLSEELDHTFSMIVGYWCLGDSHRLRGEFDTAIHLLQRALALCIDRNLPVLTPRITCCLGSAYAHGGRLAEALTMLQQTARDIEAVGERVFQSMLVAHLGEAMLLVDRGAEAAVLAQQALTLARERGERGHEARCLHLLGDITSSSDPPDAREAEDRYRGALALADELGMRPLAAHCRRGLGRLYRRTGRPDQAEEHLLAATAMFRAMGMGAPVMEQERDVAEGNA
jgi:tetratricopeptide (TPR) repeat protein